jgi:hypothetical protein
MVLVQQDNSHAASKIGGDAEQLAFAHILGHLGVADFFSYPRNLCFSWDNRHRSNSRKLKHLNRFYCLPNNQGRHESHIQSYDILGDCSVSDHLPVFLSLEILPDTSQGSRYKVNSSFLEDKGVVEQLHDKWHSLPPTLKFFGKMQHLIRCYKSFYKERAWERQARETDLRSQLERAHADLQDTPNKAQQT